MALVKYKKLYSLVVAKALWRCSLRGSTSHNLKYKSGPIFIHIILKSTRQ